MKTIKQIYSMVESAFTKKDAMEMLEWWYSYGSVRYEDYLLGKKRIKLEFK